MMKADFFYSNPAGRAVLKLMQKAHMFKPVAAFLHTKASRHMIPGYIKKNGIDMTPYGDRGYSSFADFFGRKREHIEFDPDPSALIAPCDSLLSVYDITPDLEIAMKGSLYTIPDLIPDSEEADKFRDGLCLVFRLEASDYHHFCFFDDCRIVKEGFIPGQLHSVQPIALRHFPVFRLNRRWWSVLETKNFGAAAQIEIGAMAVGGVTFVKEKGDFARGEEMGNFELAGSTIVILLQKREKDNIKLDGDRDENGEIRVGIGSVIGKKI